MSDPAERLRAIVEGYENPGYRGLVEAAKELLKAYDALVMASTRNGRADDPGDTASPR